MSYDDENFNFSKKDVRDLIIKTEKELRDVIYTILTEIYGNRWEIDPATGFEENERRDLVRRRQEETLRFPNQILSDKLLDFCYIRDLKNILQKNWQHFGQIFSSINRTCMMLDQLSLIRNPIMHGRNDILPHQYHLCIGICGEILTIIERWKFGYKSRVKSIECELKFSSSYDVDQENVKSRSLGLAENWIRKTISGLDPNIELQDNAPNDGENILLRSGTEKIKIQLINNAWFEQYRGKQYCNISVRVIADTYKALEHALSIANHPYWILTLRLVDQLDLKHIKSKAEEVAGQKQWKIGGQIQQGAIKPHAIDDVIGRSRDVSVLVKLYSGQQDSGSSLQIVCESEPGNGFYQAHKVFMVKDILEILNGQMSAVKIQDLIRKACSVTNA